MPCVDGVLVSRLGLLQNEKRRPDPDDVSEREQGQNKARVPHWSGLRPKGSKVAMS